MLRRRGEIGHAKDIFSRDLHEQRGGVGVKLFRRQIVLQRGIGLQLQRGIGLYSASYLSPYCISSARFPDVWQAINTAAMSREVLRV